MLSDETQLRMALQAYGWAHSMGDDWPKGAFSNCVEAGIDSMNDLYSGCLANTVNLDFELFGIEDQFSESTIQCLRSFLPGPVGYRCFRLATKAAQKVQKGTADTVYVHRPESGKIGEETWVLPVGDHWTMHVDCAGFIRNCLKHVTKDPFKMVLSDRDFMRAKDFYAFFSSVPYTVMDPLPISESETHMKWRIVPDLRMVIPGDIIVYRPLGNASGGAAFTTNDRKDLRRLLKAVKTAQLFHKQDNDWNNLGARNVAKDPRVRQWVDQVRAKLKAIGITKIPDLRANIDTVNEALESKNYLVFYQDTLELMKECLETRAMNTGHIVFAAGPMVATSDGDYRVRVVHSTKYGKKDENGIATTGIEEYFRRFQLKEGPNGKAKWTREMKKSPSPPTAIDDEDENPNDDMEDDEENIGDASDDEDVQPVEEINDELAGVGEVEVLAARICF